MIIQYNIDNVLFNLKSDLNKKDFLNQIGAKKGFHLEIFSIVYDSIYSGLIDIEEEYQRFFSKEYESFEDYLYKKFSLNKKEVNYIIDSNKGDDCIRFYRRAYGFYGYKSIFDYLGDDGDQGNKLQNKIFKIISKDVNIEFETQISEYENKN